MGLLVLHQGLILFGHLQCVLHIFHCFSVVIRNSEDGTAFINERIKDLMAQLAKSEEDKEKIAQEAYRKAMEIKREADLKLGDAHASQMKQVSLIERLKVRKSVVNIHQKVKGQFSSWEFNYRLKLRNTKASVMQWNPSYQK